MSEGQPLTAFETFIPGKKGNFEKDGRFRAYGHHIKDLAKFHPILDHSNWSSDIRSEWRGSASSKWVKESFNNPEKAASFCKNFMPPREIVEQAKVLSRELVRELIQNGGTPRILRHQMNGRFDSTSMRRVITDLQKGQFSAENTLPFKKRERLAPSRPHVGICADGSWRQFWQDDNYIPRVAALSLGVAWACEAVNCPVTAAITRQNSGGDRYGRYDMSVTGLILPGVQVNTADFGVVFHPELYRMSTFYVEGCSEETMTFKHRGIKWDEIKKKHAYSVLNDCSADGGDGVSFVKAHGATITVAIGNVNDKKDANICIDARASLDDAVRQIAKMLAEQNKKLGIAA